MNETEPLDNHREKQAKSIRLLVFGKVQGVFFRSSLKDYCQRAGVTGWVKNKSDGSVEVLLQGTNEKIQKAIEWCAKGPEEAEVTRVVPREVEAEPLHDDFEIVY